MKFLRFTTLLAVALIAPAAAQTGQVIYVVDGMFEGNPPQQTSTLYRIDPEDGSILETVGNTGENLVAITANYFSGDIYGVTAENSLHSGYLVRIDPETAAVSPVGELYRDNGEAVPSAHDIYFTQFDEFSSGSEFTEGETVLFMQVENEDSGGFSFTDIFGIDPDTARVFEKSGLFGDFFINGGLLGENSGVMLPVQGGYASENIAVIGCEDGGQSELRTAILMTTFMDPPLAPTTYSIPDNSCFTSAARYDAGTIYTIPISVNGNPIQLIRITVEGDVATQEILNPLPESTVGISIGPGPINEVPSISVWGLILLLLGIALITIKSRFFIKN